MKSEKKLISIIIPCLNAAKTINKTLNSLRHQTSMNFECIVMDGNSTDGTQKIIAEYSDIVTRLISENDDSGAAAVNKAIGLSKGEYVIFLYADDYLLDSAIEEITNVIKKSKSIDYISYGLQVQDLITNKISLKSLSTKNLESSLYNACFKHVLNHAYKKDIFTKIGGLKPLYFDNKTFYSNDREFLIRICLNGKKNYVIEKILYIMQNHKDSFTGSRKNIIRIRKEHIGIANFFLEGYNNLSLENKKILKLFKAHNLIILFILQIFSLNLVDSVKTFKKGLFEYKFLWFFYMISRPLSEIIYRISVRY
tara:strand:+ start:33 stop:962 length:930 start_codon:yes stop_codon:yes gene_type:complete